MATEGLSDQVYYWPDADKAIVSRALADQPDGSFIIRNASTPGDFTLTVRYNGLMKLIRIVVRGDKCGFSAEMLTHDSIVQLIEFHKSVSLSVYNDNLDIKLLFPVSSRRNSQAARLAAKRAAMNQRSIFNARTTEDWEERLGLEKLRIAQMCCERASRLYEVIHSEVERAQNLYTTLSNSIRDYDIKLEKLADLLEVEEQLTMKMSKNLENVENENLFKAMTGNQKLLEASLKRIKNEKTASVAQKGKIGLILDEMRTDMAHSKTRMLRYHEQRNKIYAELVTSGVGAEKLQITLEATADMIASETVQVSQLLADLPLRWSPVQYLCPSSSKEEAAAALMAARERMLQVDQSMGIYRPPIDGVFLIRPSQSQTDKLVLSVLYGERISHCLIEHSDQGWGFENSNIYLTTIGDFVRYYAHTSLESHNDNIKTALTMPAFPLPQTQQTPQN